MRSGFTTALLVTTMMTAQAESAEEKPSPAEIEAVKTCLAGIQKDRSYRDCVGKGVEVCLNQDEGLAVFDCQIRETAIWDGFLNDHYQKLQKGLPPKIFARLRVVQRAWITYCDAKCTFDNVWSYGDTWKLKQEHGCRLVETALRASELEALHDWLVQHGGLSK